MKRRPWILVILAVLHIFAPIGNIVLNGIWSRFGLIKYISVAIQPQNLQQNWFSIAAPILAGISIYLCRKWSFYAYLALISTMFYISYQGYKMRYYPISLYSILFVYVANALLVAYFLIPAVRQVYFDPRLRWWQTRPRYRIFTPGKYKSGNKTETGFIENFSTSTETLMQAKIRPITTHSCTML